MGSLFIGASLSADANEINFKDAELLFSSRGSSRVLRCRPRHGVR